MFSAAAAGFLVTTGEAGFLVGSEDLEGFLVTTVEAGFLVTTVEALVTVLPLLMLPSLFLLTWLLMLGVIAQETKTVSRKFAQARRLQVHANSSKLDLLTTAQ
jgi:hypothetical protein